MPEEIIRALKEAEERLTAEWKLIDDHTEELVYEGSMRALRYFREALEAGGR